MQLDVASLGLTEQEALARLADQGVRLSTTKPGILRAVTYLGIEDDDIGRAIDAAPKALEQHARV